MSDVTVRTVITREGLPAVFLQMHLQMLFQQVRSHVNNKTNHVRHSEYLSKSQYLQKLHTLAAMLIHLRFG